MLLLPTEQLATASARNHWILQRQAERLRDSERFIQPPMRSNCRNWILGHLAVHRDDVLDLLGHEALLDAGATERHAGGSAPITGPNPAALPPPVLLAALIQG